uniref:Discs, large homolog 5a (Drosophila) n=1 Tax=Denticeps clupeoides TaxID=299321 RepID=A0AAY4A1X8_9TELE
MEPRHRELLEQWHQNLLESVTDVERVLDLLSRAGTLTQAERFDLDQNCATARDKVARLLKTLVNKERDHFQEICAALEETHPHLYSSLPTNGAGVTDDSTYSVLSAMPSDSESSSSLSSVGTTGKASSPPPARPDGRRGGGEKLEAVAFQLRQVTRERDELRKRLALSSPGTTFDDCRYPGHDYERLKLQCMQAMADLKSLQSQHTKTLKRCEDAMKEADFYHTLHSRVLDEQARLKEEAEAARRDYNQLRRQHNHLQQSCEELRRLREEDQQEVADMRLQQQQVMREGGSTDILNQLYDATVDKLEGVKKEHDALRKRYHEKTANHNADLGRLEQAEEEKQRLQKQLDALLKQRDAAVHCQQQYTSSLRRFDSTQQELNKAQAENKELQRELERLQVEATRLKTLQLMAGKDVDKYKEERDSVFSEYRLIMSERDQVIKEVEKLQTGLETAQAQLKNTSSERKVASEEMEALRQKQDSAALDMERANKELEMLRKQCEAMSQELKEATQEAEVAKCRRDWAFQERDKIVAERESIRTLCDKLRRERDRAVSDQADALRNLDDMRKQKNDSVRELKELKEKLEDQLEKEARIRQLMAHNSHDSAIDTDSLEWETEVVALEKDKDDMDLKALGFEVAEGVNDPYLPGDGGIFVTKVDKGSVADGRLRVNDWLLKVNDVDLTNMDRKQVIKAMLGGGGVINMVVRRRRSLGARVVTPVHLNLVGHKGSGVSLEAGVFVSAVVPGSPAAREGSLSVGDRLVAIGGIAVDNKPLSECEALLHDCRESVSLSLLKFFPHSLSGQNLHENGEKSPSGRHLSEIHARNCRNLKHNSSTQTDIYSAEADPRLAADSSYQDVCCQRHAHHPVADEADCGAVEAVLERGHVAQKNSGGTWPKVMVGGHLPENAPLSIFKVRTKRRKSIFDTDAFKRPNTPSKLSQLPKHSEGPASPPPPPERRDSFKYKHKQQTSSASDSTITTGSPPSTPAQSPPTPDAPFRPETPGHPRSPDRAGGGRGARPNSAPAQRHNLTPLKIPAPQVTYPAYCVFLNANCWHHRAALSHRGLSPCTAVTAVMRSPVYTAWSHWVPSQMNQSRSSSQHPGRFSVDLSHKRSGELADASRARTPHSTNSLPSSARQGLLRNAQYPIERIKIPSTPRYVRSAPSPDKGSLSQSDCSTASLITPPLSPLNLETTSFASSQSQSSASTLPRLSVSPGPAEDRRKDRPYLEEPRSVTIHKGAEPLGISIVSGENGGIFVSKVTGGSIAHQYKLEFGDQLLEFNGINLRNATEQQARLIIGQQCDSITVLAQYNPHMQQLGNHSRSSSRVEPISSHSCSPGGGAPPYDDHSPRDPLSKHSDGTSMRTSKQTTPIAGPGISVRALPSPRVVTLQKPHRELGVQVCGGNLHGIFVEKLDEDSPARGDLLPGDLILEYCSSSMKNRTAEEAHLEMLKPVDVVTLTVQHRAEDFSRLRGTPGDGFYIRALYDRVAEMDQDLSFKKDDILYVDDTLPDGCFGSWMAWQLDEGAHRLQRGLIPSKLMMDQEFQRRCSITDARDDSSPGKTVSAAARRSFFRRKNKHKRSGSKDGKDLPAPDTISTDSAPYMDDSSSLAYQRVQKVDSTTPRPVLILGPLVEATKDMLVKEAPGKFCRCLQEVMKASQQAIERGVKDCLFIDYKRRSGHFDVTTVASIKEVTEKQGCHCLLDIAPHAIERLHSVQIYPIVIFIRYKNAKQIKEQKDPTYLRDKISQKHSKEQFEVAQKTEQDYSKYFTGVVQGGSLFYIYSQIVTIVSQEQSKVLWIPDGSL